MTLIEVNPNIRTALRDRSCRAVEFHYDDTIFHECKTVLFTALEKSFFFRVEVDGCLF